MKKFFKIIIIIILISGAISLAEFFFFREKLNQPKSHTQNNIYQPQKESPPVVATDAVATDNSSQNIPSSTSAPAPDPAAANPLPPKFLLPIPFHSQAPFSKWDAVHEEMCEEASVLNGGLYLLDKKITTDDFEKELMNLKKLEEKELGDYKSNTIAEIKKAADIYFAGKINSKIINDPMIEDIENEIAAGHPVIVPLAGRDIGNPNFTPPGPVYHMLVIKGYDAQNFITNDVGTRKGDSYVYKKDVIMQNMHDWNAKDIHLGAKRMLVLLKNS